MGVDHTLAGILWAGLIHRPEAVIVEESMDDSALGRDDGLIAVHTNHSLGAQTMLSGNNRCTYCIYTYFHQEKIFASFTTCFYW